MQDSQKMHLSVAKVKVPSIRRPCSS